MEKGKTLYSLMTHGATFSQEDIILNKELFSESILIGDYVQVIDPERPANRLILKVVVMQSGRMEISLSKTVSEPLQLKPFSRVYVEKVDPKDAEVDVVELTFRRQYLQRGNMWLLKRAMCGRPLHIKESVTLGGWQAQIQELGFQGKKHISGIVTEKTHFIFRSRSARIIWLVQISAEMWEYDHNGDLYFEKFLHKFVEPILDRWKVLGVSHSLSVVFFSRTLYLGASDPIAASALNSKASVHQRTDSIKFQDHFKIVINNAAEVDKISFLQTLKREFWAYPSMLKWNIPKGSLSRQFSDNTLFSQNARHSSRRPISVPSDASNGNLLEAINTSLNLLDKHYMDRDLSRTGNTIVVISAGTGAFVVKPEISLITKQRMIDGGIGIDFISLSQPPLHAVPLFHVECRSKEIDDFYDVPYWMKVSYVDCPTSQSSHSHHRRVTGQRFGEDFKPHPFMSSLNGYASLNRNTVASSLVHAYALPSPLKYIISLSIPRAESELHLERYNSTDRISEMMSLERRPSSSHLMSGISRSASDGATLASMVGSLLVPFVPGSSVNQGPDWGFVDVEYTDDQEVHHSRTNSCGDLTPAFGLGSLDKTSHLNGSNFGLLALPRLNRERLGSSFTEQGLAESYGDECGPLLSRSMSSAGHCGSPRDLSESLSSITSASRRRRLRSNEKIVSGSLESDEKEKSDICYRIGVNNLKPDEDLMKMMEDYDLNVFSPPPQPVLPAETCEYRINHEDSRNNDLDSSRHGRTKGATSTAPWLGRANSFKEPTASDRGNRMRANSGSAGHAPGGLAVDTSAELTAQKFEVGSPSSSALFGANRLKTVSGSFMDRPGFSTSPNSKSEVKARRDADFELHDRGSDARRGSVQGIALLGPSDNTPPAQGSVQSFIENYRRLHTNPFKREDLSEQANAKTHNRMRWAYISNFEDSSSDPHHRSSYNGLNMKSLCQPAILPLSTTFLPSLKTFQEEYKDQGNYNILIDCLFDTYYSKNPEKYVMDMVSQRLSQGYQLVEGVDLTPYKSYLSNMNIQVDTKGKERLYILSMGHRIHFIRYTPFNNEIKVSKLLSKHAIHGPDGATKGLEVNYTYESWTQQVLGYQTVTQLFCQFPTPEYNWSTLDNVLGGNMDLDSSNDSVIATKPKRLRFSLIPEQSGCEADYEIYFSKFDKLIQLLKTKIKDKSAFEIKIERQDIEITTKIDTKIIRLQLPLPTSDTPHWVALRYDKVACINRVYHLELHWVSCESYLIDEFVNTMFIRCRTWGLRLVQIPEYFSTADLNIHPYRSQPYISVANVPHLRAKYTSAVTYIETEYFKANAQDWIEDNRQMTRWNDLGLPEAKSLSSSNKEVRIDGSAGQLGIAAGGSYTDVTELPTKDAIEDKDRVASAAATGGTAVADASSVHANEDTTAGEISKTSSITKFISNITANLAVAASSSKVFPTHCTSSSSTDAADEPREQVFERVAPDRAASSAVPAQSRFDVVPSGRRSSITRKNSSNRPLSGISQSMELGQQVKPRVATSKHRPRTADRQFLHRRGFACVRSGVEGFVWLSNPQGRVSDINTSADKDIDFAGEALKNFRELCSVVVDVYDLVLRVVELSMKDKASALVSTGTNCFYLIDLYERHESHTYARIMNSGSSDRLALPEVEPSRRFSSDATASPAASSVEQPVPVPVQLSPDLPSIAVSGPPVFEADALEDALCPVDRARFEAWVGYFDEPASEGEAHESSYESESEDATVRTDYTYNDDEYEYDDDEDLEFSKFF